MNLYVHSQLTREWAIDEGFGPEDAAEIARWNTQVDVAWPGRRLKYRRFHLRPCGATRIGEAYWRAAVRERSLPHLGVALHMIQDAIGHGLIGAIVHVPVIDAWERRSARVRERIEAESRRIMRAYRSGVAPEVSGSDPPTPLPPA